MNKKLFKIFASLTIFFITFYSSIPSGVTAKGNGPTDDGLVIIGDMNLSSNPVSTRHSDDSISDNLRGVDAGSIILTESVSQTLIVGNSAACNMGGIHTDNHYLRIFDLPTFGIDKDFKISNVSFGIEQSIPAGTTQPLQVRLYTLNGIFQFANMTLISTTITDVTSQEMTILNVPVSGTAPAGSKLVVDIFTPDGEAAGNSFFIGSNNLGETGPSYIAAAECGIPEPTLVANVGYPNMMIVMNVTGTVLQTTWINYLPLIQR